MLNRINHTQTSNDYIDKFMPILPAACTVVFLAISRKTIGWHKDVDAISNSQICKMTGLSKNTVIRAIKELEANNIIQVIRQKSDIDRNHINLYTVNYIELSQQVVQNLDYGSAKIEPEVVQILNQGSANIEQTKETITKDKRNMRSQKMTAEETELKDFIIQGLIGYHKEYNIDFFMQPKDYKYVKELYKRLLSLTNNNIDDAKIKFLELYQKLLELKLYSGDKFWQERTVDVTTLCNMHKNIMSAKKVDNVPAAFKNKFRR